MQINVPSAWHSSASHSKYSLFLQELLTAKLTQFYRTFSQNFSKTERVSEKKAMSAFK